MFTQKHPLLPPSHLQKVSNTRFLRFFRPVIAHPSDHSLSKAVRNVGRAVCTCVRVFVCAALRARYKRNLGNKTNCLIYRILFFRDNPKSYLVSVLPLISIILYRSHYCCTPIVHLAEVNLGHNNTGADHFSCGIRQRSAFVACIREWHPIQSACKGASRVAAAVAVVRSHVTRFGA